MKSRLLFVAIAICVGRPAHGQVERLTDSARKAFYSTTDDYTHEKGAIAKAPHPVTRRLGDLQVTLASGRRRQFVDTLEEGDHYVRFIYSDYLRAPKLHVVDIGYYENTRTLLIHDPTGRSTYITGELTFSPDSARFVAASLDLDAEYDPNVLEVWRVDANGPHREFRLEGGRSWGPDQIRWAGRDTVFYRRVTTSEAAEKRDGLRYRAVHRGTKWTVERVVR